MSKYKRVSVVLLTLCFVFLTCINAGAYNDYPAGKAYISFGDSITWQDKREYGQGAHIGEIARGYQTVVSERLDLSASLNKGDNGYSMAKKNNKGVVDTITSFNNFSGYDLCTIACGTNDFKLNVPIGELKESGVSDFDITTFYGAYQKSIEHILSLSPDIELILMTPLYRSNGGYNVDTVNTAGHKLIDYITAINELGNLYDLPVCDMFVHSGINAQTLRQYTIDGLHPNDEGYKHMGRVLACFIATGKYHIAGDVNYDGEISICDVTALQRFVAQFESFDDEQLLAADCNGNGVADINDATLIQMYLAEYELDYPIGESIIP